MILQNPAARRSGASRAACGAIAAALALGVSTSALAQATPSLKTETTAYDNWVLTCQEGPGAGGKGTVRNCWATLRVTEDKNKQVLLVWMLGKDAKGTPTISIQTPTGLLLKDGLTVALGDKTRRLPFVSCDTRSCEAASPYDAAFAGELAAAKEATISLPAKNGQTISLKMNLAGTDKVLAQLKK